MNDSINDFDDSLISAYLDGELGEAEREQVETAIKNSAALQMLVKELSGIKSLVAVSVKKSEPLTRSLQSGEWLANGIENIAPHADIARGESSKQVDYSRQKFRYSLGILASLAAVIAVVASLSSLKDFGLVSGPQVAWEQSPPMTRAPSDSPIGAGFAANAEEDSPSAAPGSMASVADSMSSSGMTINSMSIEDDQHSAERTFAKQSDALPNEPLVTSKANRISDPSKLEIPENAKSLLAYIEQRLNVASDSDLPKIWSLHLSNSVTAPDTANPKLVTNTPEKRIQVEIGPADDEVILQVAEDDLNDVLSRLNEKLELTSEQNQQHELLAIAAFTPGVVERVERVEKAKDATLSTPSLPANAEWSIKLASPTEVMLLADATGNRAAGVGNKNSNLENYRSSDSLQSNTGAASALGSPPGTRAMKSARQLENRAETSDVTALAKGAEASNFAQSEASYDEAVDPGVHSRFTRDSKNREKLKRIRIKIKKEPTSSGSSE